MSKRPKRPAKWDITSFAVRGEYAGVEVPQQLAFDIRNAQVNFRDRGARTQIIDIKVRGTKTRPGDQDPEILWWVQISNPEVWMHSGLMRIQGFGEVVVANGEKLDSKDRFYGRIETPKRLMDVALTPEACLDADGEFRDPR